MKRSLLAASAVLAGLLLWISLESSANQGATLPAKTFGRGVTISCRGWGADWARPGMAEAMDEIKSLGGNWITYHPYAWIRNNGSLRHRNRTDDSTVLSPIKEAKKRALKVMLKPHIGYWGSRFDWRGSIAFEKEEDWQRFFKDYEDFIVTQAKMAQSGGADLFCVGVEYKATLGRDKDWRRIIAAVRKVYKGKVTYAANWDSYQRVTFWDALDFIGVQAYFPLSNKENPSAADISAGWDSQFKSIKAYAASKKKKVIFTELGYNRSSQAAAKPWEHQGGGPNAAAIKLRCMKVALARVEKESFIESVFLWKWFPNKINTSRNFNLQYKEMKSLIKTIWTAPKAKNKNGPAPKPKKSF
jgi:hypothetical protein